MAHQNGHLSYATLENGHLQMTPLSKIHTEPITYIAIALDASFIVSGDKAGFNYLTPLHHNTPTPILLNDHIAYKEDYPTRRCFITPTMIVLQHNSSYLSLLKYNALNVAHFVYLMRTGNLGNLITITADNTLVLWHNKKLLFKKYADTVYEQLALIKKPDIIYELPKNTIKVSGNKYIGLPMPSYMVTTCTDKVIPLIYLFHNNTHVPIYPKVAVAQYFIQRINNTDT